MSLNADDKRNDTEVTDGCLVTLDYEVKLPSGKLVDSSAKTGGPARIICGQGQFPRPVEEQIVGLKVGDRRVIDVSPEYTYGYYDLKKVVLVARERISGDIELGKVSNAPDDFGIRRPAVVLQVWEGAVLVDFNHPLAGKLIKFEVVIRDIKPADHTNSSSNINELQLAS